MSVYDVVVDVLTRVVGRPATVICVRSAAVQLSKKAEDFTAEDLPAVEKAIRNSLGSFASGALLDQAVAEIESRA